MAIPCLGLVLLLYKLGAPCQIFRHMTNIDIITFIFVCKIVDIVSASPFIVLFIFSQIPIR